MQKELLLTAIFCDVDEFCKGFEKYCREKSLPKKSGENEFFPKSKMSLSEIMTITIWFHLSHYRQFKWFYKDYIQGHLKPYFPHTVSYNRFVELMQTALLALTLYMMKFRVGKCTGISIVDSTTLEVCNSRRERSHKVFKGKAQKGKSSTGWFYGFKLHLIINDRGEIISFCLTPGNVDDRNVDVMEHLTKNLFGKLFGDKGYLSSKLFKKLFEKGIFLVTKIKKNMKNVLMDYWDKFLLRKRGLIESVNNLLKQCCQIEHSRHRSQSNFLVNLISGLIAYSFIDKKPSLGINRDDMAFFASI
jgi:hypothetical protein